MVTARVYAKANDMGITHWLSDRYHQLDALLGHHHVLTTIVSGIVSLVFVIAIVFAVMAVLTDL